MDSPDDAEWGRLQKLATQVAGELAGLDVEAARMKVGSFAGLSIQFADASEPVTTDFVVGRITAWTRDEVVLQATAG